MPVGNSNLGADPGGISVILLAMSIRLNCELLGVSQNILFENSLPPLGRAITPVSQPLVGGEANPNFSRMAKDIRGVGTSRTLYIQETP